MGKLRKRSSVRYYGVFAGVFAIVIGGGALALQFKNSATWKEEVLLHTGDRMIVERSHKLGGRREPGQGPPLAEQTASFTPPGKNERISWRATYGIGENDTNLTLLAIEIVDDKVYLVTRPSTCMSYNKWGRPNPFYVFFVYDEGNWQRTPISDVPSAIKTPNVIIGPLNHHQRLKQSTSAITADEISRTNSGDFIQPSMIHFRVFGREPVTSGEDNMAKACKDVIYRYNAERQWIEESPRTNK